LALKQMSMAELRAYWESLFRSPAPPYNRAYLEKRLAYKLQEQEYGSVSQLDRARMAGLLEQEGYDQLGQRQKRRERSRQAGQLPVGAELESIEWHGQRHRVRILEDGVEFRGRKFRSLTAVTKEITGSHRSGREFFGLRPITRGW
jgi:hypothetical protein